MLSVVMKLSMVRVDVLSVVVLSLIMLRVVILTEPYYAACNYTD